MLSVFLLIAQLSTMSADEQKQTGFSKLSQKQKVALQEWVDANYEKRSEPLTSSKNQQKGMLEENLHNGQYIRLSGGLLWNIRPEDTPITQGWITPVDIYISPSGDADYPYKLTNSLTNSSVLARKAKKVPPTPKSATPPPQPQKQ